MPKYRRRRENFEDMPERPTEEGYAYRREVYRENVRKVQICFERYGIRRVSGEPNESLRRIAVERIVDMQGVLGGDRITISDYLAVIPNYYGTYTPPWEMGDDGDFVRSRTLPPARSSIRESGMMVYTIALELVIRDFRNYEAMYEPLATGNIRELRHPVGSPYPPVEPNLYARVFDIPLGYISNFKFDETTGYMDISLVGQHKERMKIRHDLMLIPHKVYSSRKKEAKEALKELDLNIEDDLTVEDEDEEEFDDMEWETVLPHDIK